MRRGFTMVEMMLAVSLTAIVVGVMASIFVFTSYRLSDAYTQASLIDQVSAVADDIETTIRNANACATKDAGATLVCTMPKTAIDSDGDGYDDTFYPDGVDGVGKEKYSPGEYVWYYVAGAAGTYLSGSGQVWRADSTSPSAPTSAQINKTFMRYPAGQLRNPLVTTASFTVTPAAKTVKYTVGAGARIGSSSSDTSDSTSSRTVSVTRTVVWRK